MGQETDNSKDSQMDVPMTAAEMAVYVTAASKKLTALRMTPREWIASGMLHIGSNGTPVWNSAGGVNTVTEASASGISQYTYNAQYLAAAQLPSIAALSPSNGDVLKRRIGIKQSTLVNGAIADVELVAALASYYGVFKIDYIIMDNAPAGGTIVCTFQDSDNAALTGLVSGAATITPLANTVNTQLQGAVLYKGTDNKALEVDFDTGGGAGDNGKKITIGYTWWYET